MAREPPNCTSSLGLLWKFVSDAPLAVNFLSVSPLRNKFHKSRQSMGTRLIRVPSGGRLNGLCEMLATDWLPGFLEQYPSWDKGEDFFSPSEII